MATSNFYTYLWLREDGVPYYAGKGSGQRAFWKHRSGFKLNPPPRERIVLQEWPNETDAFAAEIFLIQYYGRIDQKTGPLRNLTDGGEGSSGYAPSPACRKKLSMAGRGRKFSEEHKRKISLAHLGRPKSKEAVEASRRTRTGMKQSLEHAQHSRTIALGRRHSEESRRKISNKLKGRIFSETTLQRMRAAARSRKERKREAA
jgi:hypothetical protein